MDETNFDSDILAPFSSTFVSLVQSVLSALEPLPPLPANVQGVLHAGTGVRERGWRSMACGVLSV